MGVGGWEITKLDNPEPLETIGGASLFNCQTLNLLVVLFALKFSAVSQPFSMRYQISPSDNWPRRVPSHFISVQLIQAHRDESKNVPHFFPSCAIKMMKFKN